MRFIQKFSEEPKKKTAKTGLLTSVRKVLEGPESIGRRNKVALQAQLNTEKEEAPWLRTQLSRLVIRDTDPSKEKNTATQE